MAYSPTALAQNCEADTDETTIYTVGSGLQAIVKQIVLANVTSSAAVYSVSIVPSGGTAGVTNRILEQVSIPANSTVNFDLSQVMDAGDFISIKQGTSSACTATVSGVELTASSPASAFTFLDAAGDLMYASAADTPARLAIGTAGQVLTVNSGATAPEWAAAAGGTSAWDDWTPSLTNLTQGNGTITARFFQQGKLVHWRFTFTLGSTSAVGSDPKFSLPVAAAAIYASGNPIGVCNLADTGTTLRNGQIWWFTGGLGRIIYWDTNNALGLLSSTAPHTWANTDVISAFGTYEAA